MVTTDTPQRQASTTDGLTPDAIIDDQPKSILQLYATVCAELSALKTQVDRLEHECDTLRQRLTATTDRLRIAERQATGDPITAPIK